MIAAFGEFVGGELNYWEEDNKEDDLDKLAGKPKQQFQIGTGLALFNGNSAHSVENFEGDRFSVVYFTSGSHAKLDAGDVSVLRELGMQYPTPDEDQYSLLRAPRGFKSRGQAHAKGSSLPASRFWTRRALEKTAFKKRKWTAKELAHAQERHSALSKKTFVLRRPTRVADGRMDMITSTPSKRPRKEAPGSGEKKPRK